LQSIDAKKLINRILKSILTEGANSDAVTDGLKELRPYAIEEKDPTVTRVIRTTYEHIEEFGGFHIGLPEDDEDGDAEAAIEGLDEQSNSLYYLVSLLLNTANPRNREEIIIYRDALKAFWQENA